VAEWDTAVPARPERRPLDLDVEHAVLVALAPAGGVVTVESDGDAVLWREPEPPWSPGGDAPARFTSSEPLGPGVRAVAVRGELAAVAGADGNLRLHDVSRGGPPVRSGVFVAHSSGVNAVAFGPDGHTLLSAGDSELRFWETRLDLVIDRVCATAHPGITDRQWAVYFPDLPYDPPCANP
ncbi:WD40 repeat domain-containing protein, partial [Actinosynnema sp. NPDC023658]|uniref:WD40 repeat domain-containing protein n=1 Tax=Actinosynnema sp. NPDC023658 TaxID=3155465 RepID=UPI0033F628CB